MLAAAYYLPDWVPGSQYVEIAQQLGLKDVRMTDWSQHVVSKLVFINPFFVACMHDKSTKFRK